MNVRKEIHDGAKMFFGEEIKISERVFQSLEVTTKNNAPPGLHHIWKGMTEVFPAIIQVYDIMGIDYEVVKKGMPHLYKYDNKKHSFDSRDWERVFGKIFSHTSPSYEKKLTPSANKIIAAKSLDLNSLFEGIISLSRNTIIKYKDGNSKEIELTNLVLRHLFVGAGLKREINHGLASQGFIESILRAFNQIIKQDISFSDQQFILYHDKDKIRIAPFGFFGTNQLNNEIDPQRLLIARSNIIQNNYPFSLDSIAELEDLIDKNALEKDFQNFFERNPKYLLSLGHYSNIHSQLVIHEDGGTNLIPDFFLEKINSDFCDILDLKRAQKELIRLQTNRVRFKDAIMEGVAQLRTYRDFFEDRYNRDKFKSTYGLTAYKPRVVLVIGRKQSYYDEVENIKLQSSLPEWVTLKTYDDIVDKAKMWNLLK